jgi:hypothetical protein
MGTAIEGLKDPVFENIYTRLHHETNEQINPIKAFICQALHKFVEKPTILRGGQFWSYGIWSKIISLFGNHVANSAPWVGHVVVVAGDDMYV